MLLKNKGDGLVYRVSSEDTLNCIRIFAMPCHSAEGKPFIMHYKSLEEINNEWEDVND